jgi:hypothetical protein
LQFFIKRLLVVDACCASAACASRVRSTFSIHRGGCRRRKWRAFADFGVALTKGA